MMLGTTNIKKMVIASPKRKEVTDLTLESNKRRGLVSIWYVSVITLSHHKSIPFKPGDLEATRVTYQDSKTANLESYQKDLKANLVTDMVQQAILSSCHQNCTAKVACLPRTRTKSWPSLKHQQDGFLIKLNEQLTPNYVRRPSPITIKKSRALSSRLGETTSGDQGSKW